MIQICPACSVQIDGDRVIFSRGEGTRQRLTARVCQYAKRPGCINKQTDIKTCDPQDFYGD